MEFDVDKESILDLLDSMRGTVENLDFDDDLSVYVFASTMIHVGNEICLNLMINTKKRS